MIPPQVSTTNHKLSLSRRKKFRSKVAQTSEPRNIDATSTKELVDPLSERVQSAAEYGDIIATAAAAAAADASGLTNHCTDGHRMDWACTAMPASAASADRLLFAIAPRDKGRLHYSTVIA